MRLQQRLFVKIYIAGIALSLSACSIFPESPPQDIYRLPPSAVSAAFDKPSDISLRIARPSASGILNSSRIVVIPEGNRLSVYEGASWSSPAPSLWQNHMVDAFRNDGRITYLSSTAEGLRADLELSGTLRAFQTEYHEGMPQVVILFDANLVETGSKRIISSQRFSITKEVNGEQLSAVVDTFGKASDAMAKKLINWTLQHVEKGYSH